jgi:predicted aspartyl protease
MRKLNFHLNGGENMKCEKKFIKGVGIRKIKDIVTLWENIYFLLMIFCFCLYASTVLAGKVYKWRDDQGRMHFTDNQQNIPKEAREKLEEFELKTDESLASSEKNEIEKTVIKEEDVEKNQITIPFVAKEGMDSRIIVDVKFNNKVTVPMLLDTGSPEVIICAKLASQLGLFSEDGNNLIDFISGIGGGQMALRTIIDKIDIGEVTEEFIPTHIVPSMSDSFDGLIGMNILSGYNITIDSINNKLILTPNPAAKDLPAGRDKSWWKRTFREFRAHKEFWETHAELVRRGKGPYSSMGSSRREKYEEDINYQARVAQDLYNKLTRFAGWRTVPMTWRK